MRNEAGCWHRFKTAAFSPVSTLFLVIEEHRFRRRQTPMQPQAEKSSTARYRIEIKKSGGQRNANPPAPSVGIGTTVPTTRASQILNDGHEDPSPQPYGIRSTCVGSHLDWPLRKLAVALAGIAEKPRDSANERHLPRKNMGN